MSGNVAGLMEIEAMTCRIVVAGLNIEAMTCRTVAGLNIEAMTRWNVAVQCSTLVTKNVAGHSTVHGPAASLVRTLASGRAGPASSSCSQGSSQSQPQ